MGRKEISVDAALEIFGAEVDDQMRPRAAVPVPARTSGPIASLPKQILAHHRACRRAQATAITHAIEAGELLHEAKHHTPPGKWLSWVKASFSAETGLTPRTAQTYMMLADRKEELNSILDAKRASQSVPATMAELTIRTAQRLLRGHEEPTRHVWYGPSAPCISIDLLRDSAARMNCALDVAVGQPDAGQRRVIVQAALDSVESTIDAAVIGHAEGNLDVAILLLPLDPISTWFGKTAGYPVVLLRNSVSFPKRARNPQSNTALRAGVLVLLADGALDQRLAALCATFGSVLVPYRASLTEERFDVEKT